MGSCRCCPGVEEVGHLASPVSECRLTCGGEVGLAIACLTVGVVVGSAWVEEAAVVVAAVEQRLVAC